MNMISLEKCECDGLVCVKYTGFGQSMRVLMFKLKHGDSILKFTLTATEVNMNKTTNSIKKNPYNSC